MTRRNDKPIELEKWPEIFKTGVIPPGANKHAVCADGFYAWAMCMSGNTPPDSFGMVMVEIGNYLDHCTATAEGLKEWLSKNPLIQE